MCPTVRHRATEGFVSYVRGEVLSSACSSSGAPSANCRVDGRTLAPSTGSTPSPPRKPAAVVSRVGCVVDIAV